MRKRRKETFIFYHDLLRMMTEKAFRSNIQKFPFLIPHVKVKWWENPSWKIDERTQNVFARHTKDFSQHPQSFKWFNSRLIEFFFANFLINKLTGFFLISKAPWPMPSWAQWTRHPVLSGHTSWMHSDPLRHSFSLGSPLSCWNPRKWPSFVSRSLSMLSKRSCRNAIHRALLSRWLDF